MAELPLFSKDGKSTGTVTVAEPWVKGLRGVTVPDAGVRILDGPRDLVSRRGSLLFTHFGLSGPVILDVSRVVSGHPQPRSLHLEIDLLPDVPETEFDQFLQTEALAAGKKQLANVLAVHVPHRLAETLLTLTGQPADRKATGLSRADRGQLACHVHMVDAHAQPRGRVGARQPRQATHLAMARAVRALSIAPEFALVDGNDAPALPCRCDTLIDGDARSVSIAAASIVA